MFLAPGLQLESSPKLSKEHQEPAQGQQAREVREPPGSVCNLKEFCIL